MYTDPYQVLGVSRDASMDEVKKAYRTLSRKYHPDANVGKPDAAQSEEKFKDIQQAYQQIVDEKEHGGSRYSYNQGYGTGGAGQSYSNSNAYGNIDPHLQAAQNYINNRYFSEALNVLNNMPSSERTADWYYLSAIANAGNGNNIAAMDYAKQAASMEPNNIRYQQLLNALQGGSQWYQNVGKSYGSPTSAGSFCVELIFLNLFCNCCCRPF